MIFQKQHITALGFFIWSAVSFAAMGEETEKSKLVIVDSDDDNIDGQGLLATMEAYMAEIDVETIVVSEETPAAGRDAAVARAKELGKSTGALAVMWIEQSTDAGASSDVTMVFLEVSTAAVVAIPVVLGDRSGTAALRVLAASARTVMDTRLLDAVKEVETITRVEPTPEPWPPPEKSEPRLINVYASYTGALALTGVEVLHGARASLFQHLSKRWMLGLEIGFLSGLEKKVADIRFNERRLPVRLMLAFALPVGRTEGALVASFGPEPVWVDAEIAGDSDEGDLGAFGRLDAAGGLSLCWSFPIVWKLSAFASAGAEFLAVSHYYVRGGETAVDAGCCRLDWRLGVSLIGL